MKDLVTVRAEAGGVRVLTLDSPAKRNAIDRALRDELVAAVAGLAADADARALVVTGAGPAFCSGGDLPDLLGSADRPVHELRADLTGTYDSFLSVARLPIPSIAAVHGAAVGAGLNLAMACDLRIMGPDGYLDAGFSRLGIHPGGGATFFLVRALGEAGALELLLRGGRLSATEAVGRGLANSVADDPVAAALELAHHVAGLDPELVRDMRATVRLAAAGDLATTLAAEGWAQAASMARNPAVLRPRRPRS